MFGVDRIAPPPVCSYPSFPAASRNPTPSEKGELNRQVAFDRLRTSEDFGKNLLAPDPTGNQVLGKTGTSSVLI
jgi:hypothetical protein